MGAVNAVCRWDAALYEVAVGLASALHSYLNKSLGLGKRKVREKDPRW